MKVVAILSPSPLHPSDIPFERHVAPAMKLVLKYRLLIDGQFAGAQGLIPNH